MRKNGKTQRSLTLVSEKKILFFSKIIPLTNFHHSRSRSLNSTHGLALNYPQKVESCFFSCGSHGIKVYIELKFKLLILNYEYCLFFNFLESPDIIWQQLCICESEKFVALLVCINPDFCVF